MTTQREQPWSDEETGGRIVVLTRNPIAVAVEAIGRAAGRTVLVVEQDTDGAGVAAFADLALTEDDAVVLCDHDAPDAPQVLRDALASPAAYVAMMASKRRAVTVRDVLEGVPGLEKLHVPAGLNIGGKAPGEIALSVVAEIVAEAHGRPGGPMREG